MNKKEIINKVLNGNCVEILKKFNENLIDLTITSPPYDNLRNYKGFVFEFELIAEQIYRVTKDGGVLVWVVADATINGSETGTSFKQALKFMDLGFNLHDTMIFRKTNPIPQLYRKRFNNEFEYMFVFTKGPIKTHNKIMIDCLHAGLRLDKTTYKNYSKNDQKREKYANPVKPKKLKGNIWEYVVGKKKEDVLAKGHSAPFPFQLAYDHIVSWSNKDDLVLDPMCGSGTTLVAAKTLNRKFIGIDISEEYCELSRMRLNEKQDMLNF